MLIKKTECTVLRLSQCSHWLVCLNEKVEKGLSLKKKVIVDYEKYDCYIDIFKGILKGLRHDDILNGSPLF